LNLKVWDTLKYLVEKTPDAVATEMTFYHGMCAQMRAGYAVDMDALMPLRSELLSEAEVIQDHMHVVFPPRWVADREKGSAIKVIKKTVNYKNPLTPDRLEGVKYTKIKFEVFNPGSTQQIASRLISKYGWKPSAFTKGGAPEITEDTLKLMPYPEAKEFMKFLKARKKLSQVEGFLKAEKDGVVYGFVNTCGAVTHRCTHSRPNVAQVDKEERIRAVWVPRKGRKQVGVDAAGLEMRMLAHYLFRFDQGEYAKTVIEGTEEEGTDAHTRNKESIGLASRDGAKPTFYAFLYGSGNPNLGHLLCEDFYKHGKPAPTTKTGRKMSQAMIGKIVRERLMRGISGLEKLIEGVQGRAKAGWLNGIDGRRIEIRSKHAALNTLLQSAGSIVMKKAFAIFWRKHWKDHGKTFWLLVNVHDEQQMEALDETRDGVYLPEFYAHEFAQAITDAGVELGVRCPLAGSFKIGNNWSETH